MIEAAIDITGARIDAADIGRILRLAKDMLQHPVELLPGIREAVEAIAARYEVVLITKGEPVLLSLSAYEERKQNGQV